MNLVVAARRLAAPVLLGVVPLASLGVAFAIFAGGDNVAVDFHHELYPQAEEIVHWRSPYPAPDADLSDGRNAIWPVAAVLPVVPLTVLPPAAADFVAIVFVLACLAAALLVLGVTDWRIYGVLLLWPPVINAYQTANLTLPLVLLVAVAWRFRERSLIAGGAVAAALALKFFLWPLLVWLVAVRRVRAALLAAALGASSLLLVTPFISIPDYARLLRNLSRTFEHHAYTLFALLTDLHTPSAPARVATLAVGAAVLVLAWRRRSLGLAIAAALVLSPIVWLHFFALLAVPLALARPRFDAAWLIPLAMWTVPGTLNGDTWQTAVCLAAFAATVVAGERPRGSAPVRPAAARVRRGATA